MNQTPWRIGKPSLLRLVLHECICRHGFWVGSLAVKVRKLSGQARGKQVHLQRAHCFLDFLKYMLAEHPIAVILDCVWLLVKRPSKCSAVTEVFLAMHQFQIVIASWHSSLEAVPPFWLMYVTAVTLSKRQSATISDQVFLNACNARNAANNSRQLM